MRRRKNARASAAVWRKVMVRFACHGGPVRKDLKCCWVTFLTRCIPQFKTQKRRAPISGARLLNFHNLLAGLS